MMSISCLLQNFEVGFLTRQELYAHYTHCTHYEERMCLWLTCLHTHLARKCIIGESQVYTSCEWMHTASVNDQDSLVRLSTVRTITPAKNENGGGGAWYHDIAAQRWHSNNCECRDEIM